MKNKKAGCLKKSTPPKTQTADLPMPLSNRKLLMILFCLVVSVGAFVMFWSTRNLISQQPSGLQKPPEIPRSKPTSAGPHITPPAVADPEKIRRIELLDDLIRRWTEVGTTFKGEELLEKQRQLSKEAISLGRTDEFLAFLNFLKERGASDIWESSVKDLGDRLFSGKDAAASREWLISVQDAKLREKLCYDAGGNFIGEGLADYIGKFHPDQHSESAVLTGYCITLAKSDPEKAVKTFFELRPSNVDFSGLVEIMGALPPTTDFTKISTNIPADGRGALAQSARSALLQSWATAKPADAAQYVISNTTLASPTQMAAVMGTWARIAPDAAARWADDLAPGDLRDEAVAALAVHWTASDPAKGWQSLGKIVDLKKRTQTATTVFKEWKKSDPNAATDAWDALFPQNR